MRKTLRLSGMAGADKVLHLDVPVDAPNTEYEVLVVVEPRRSGQQSGPTHLAWPLDFIERTAGSIDDDTFLRQPQGQYEERLDLE